MMRYPISTLRAGTWRTRRFAPPVLTLLLLAVSGLLSPSYALGGPIAGPTPYGDDIHSASLNPSPLIQVSTLGSCAWISAGLNAFDAVNPNWSYSWATKAQEAAVEKGISLVPFTYKGTNYTGYDAYVVQKPAVTAANGHVFKAGTSGELGGAVLNLQYMPQAGAPPIGTQKDHYLHWIQALSGTLWGHTVGPILDTDVAYKSQSTVTPFYDVVSPGAGKLPNNGAWFEDRPLVPEFDSYWTHKEYEGNPVASLQFQVVLVDDYVKNGKHVLTLYGGEWWGFTYTAVENPNAVANPEPASCLLMALGGCGLFFLRRMTGRMRVA
jgi:hypothetical protein